jgi:hypothetical protein
MRLSGTMVMYSITMEGLIHGTVNITYDLYKILLTKCILYLSNLVVNFRFSLFN